MIYYPQDIYFPVLCPIYFGDLEEVEFYPSQEEFLPKILSAVKIIVFFSIDIYNIGIENDIYTAGDLTLNIYSKNNEKKLSKTISIVNLNDTYYYAIIDFTITQIEGLGREFFGYFTIESAEYETSLARSVYYLFNPIYNLDIKTIKYFNSVNDFNMIFTEADDTTHVFNVDIECGFVPDDVRIETEIESFVDQDLINTNTYGDEYEVKPLLIGDSYGIPTWMRRLISNITLCDSIEIEGKSYKRANGAKIEKTETHDACLANYKIDLQETENHLQFWNNQRIFSKEFSEEFK